MENYRKIYEQYYGEIPDGFHIHHKDFNHNNNNFNNLEALSPDDHAKKHGFLNNFIMAQARACDLAIIRLKTPEIRKKMSESMKSSKAHKIGIEKRNTSEYREKMAKVARSTTKNRKKYDVWNKGVIGLCFASKETKNLMSEQRMGRKWFNDGIKEYFRFEKENDWYVGRLDK